MDTVSVVNQKGGVGKTTTTICLATALSKLGHSTLVIDLDPQMNGTKWMLGRELEEDEASVLDAIITAGDESQSSSDWPLARLIEPSDLGFDFVPAHADLANVEGEIGEKPSRPYLLRERVQEVKEKHQFEHLDEVGAHNGSDEAYDICLIDCPPSLGLLVVQALTASDGLIVPVSVDGMSMQGLSQLVTTTREVRKYLNESVEITGLLPNNLDYRAGLVNEGLEALRKNYEDLVLDTEVPWRSKIIEASTYGTTLYDHAPSSDAIEIYENLAQEVVSRTSAGGIEKSRSSG
ncbi:ParA family protein [Salinibacter altiplanensis]|uniref:ParA family protein n=1 Tax=Salinibacter altiplanensis TaxID=1803181 RepID=UPI000C9F4799|nr:ParA family protein [Salinibacter altiplanensis]